MSALFRTIALSILRQLLTLLAKDLVSHGLLEGSDEQKAVAATVTLAGVAWDSSSAKTPAARMKAVSADVDLKGVELRGPVTIQRRGNPDGEEPSALRGHQ